MADRAASVGTSPVVLGGTLQSPSVEEFQSPAPYDAVEAGITQSGNSGPIELRVYEFCAGDS